MARSNTSLPSRAERCSERRSIPFSAAAARQYSMFPWTHTQTSQPHPGPDPGGSFPRDPNSPSPASRTPSGGGLEGRTPAPYTSASQTQGTAPHQACFSRRTRTAHTRTRLRCSRCSSFAPVAKLTAARRGRGLETGRGLWRAGPGWGGGARGPSLNQLQTRSGACCCTREVFLAATGQCGSRDLLR